MRERLACSERELPEALSQLLRVPEISEGAILSTCNRMELYVTTEEVDTEAVRDSLVAHLADHHELHPSEFQPHLYIKEESEAALHLMRVASGLDSLVLGETQILGQVRAALLAGQVSESVGGVLTALFQYALSAGKRIHHETALSRGAFSVGHVAVDLAHTIFGDLSKAQVLILGAGKMSELTARHLRDSGAPVVLVANRTFEKAQQLAAKFAGRAIQYEEFPEALATADVVISSTASPRPIITHASLLPALKKRRGKPLLLIDIAVPRDIDPEVARLDNVFLKNIDDLEEMMKQDALDRAGEAAIAEQIVEEERSRFIGWYRQRDVAPVISHIKDHLERIRRDNMERTRTKLSHLSDKDWHHIETMTMAMMNQYARDPILRLKEEALSSQDGINRRYQLAEAVRNLFPAAVPNEESVTLIGHELAEVEK